MIAKMRRAKLIYEPHEFETGTSNSTFLKNHLSNLVERILISRIDLLIVVSECVAQAYETLYTNVKPFVIRNLSTTFPVEERILLNKNIRADLGVKTTELLFIYQGLLSKERGTEQICRAFTKLDMKAHIIFIGNGPYEQNVRKFCSTYSNIHWMNMVPTYHIDTLTRQCDAGIIFLDPSCLNHEYALPNKFFQYLSSGLPVLASDRRQLQVYIDGWKLGWTFQNEIDLVERIQNMNKSILLFASSAIEKFNSENNWEIEEQKLKALYEQVLEEIR
jgi:glycosyltransferase involved in cell wall biosynthesis